MSPEKDKDKEKTYEGGARADGGVDEDDDFDFDAEDGLLSHARAELARIEKARMKEARKKGQSAEKAGARALRNCVIGTSRMLQFLYKFGDNFP